jgi:hypothetical protein
LDRDGGRAAIAGAIRLTVLAAKKDPENFDGLALRCIVRMVEERELSIDKAIWALQRFQDCREGVDGETGLLKLAHMGVGSSTVE